jgi:hypothetical protein
METEKFEIAAKLKSVIRDLKIDLNDAKLPFNNTNALIKINAVIGESLYLELYQKIQKITIEFIDAKIIEFEKAFDSL